MGRRGGLRHGAIGATPRPSPQAVSAHPGGDPRLAGSARRARLPGSRTNATRTMTHRPASFWKARQSRYRREASSAQITKLRYAYQCDADRCMLDPNPSEMSARDVNLLHSFSIGLIQNDRAANPPGTSRPLSDRLTGDQSDRSLHTRRRRWRLARYREPCSLRRLRPSASSSARRRAARSDRHDPTAGLSRNRASQSRSDFQRFALAQSRSTLPALTHDP